MIQAVAVKHRQRGGRAQGSDKLFHAGVGVAAFFANRFDLGGQVVAADAAQPGLKVTVVEVIGGVAPVAIALLGQRRAAD